MNRTGPSFHYCSPLAQPATLCLLKTKNGHSSCHCEPESQAASVRPPSEGEEGHQKTVLMWSQEVLHNRQTDLSPGAPPPPDGASAQPTQRRLATARSEDIEGIKKTPTRPHQSKLARKVEQRRGGLKCARRKTCGRTLAPRELI